MQLPYYRPKQLSLVCICNNSGKIKHIRNGRVIIVDCPKCKAVKNRKE